MNGAPVAPVAPWVGIAIVVAGLLAMLGGIRLLAGHRALSPEVSRKLAHVGLGLATLSFPWLFASAWPVVVIAGIAVATLLALRYVPALQREMGGVVHGVSRASAGDLYFPLAATGLFVLSAGDRVLYVIPLLTLALADAVAALIGTWYGQLRYEGADGKKSLEGSVAFLLVAFLATHVPLLLFTTTGRLESLLIGLTFGVLVMLLEAIAWRGLDNLFIPFGGFLLLRAFLAMDAVQLAWQLGVTLALVVVAIVMRRQRTLTDAAVLGGALVVYFAWSVAGRAWAVPPLALFVLYTLLWPRAKQVRLRPHDMSAVIAVNATALLWLLLSVAFANAEYYFPYVVTFAAHLCFIGVSWMRQYRRRDGVLVAALVAWTAFFVPYTLIVGLDAPGAMAMSHAGIALAAVVLAGWMFARTVPPFSERHPWGRQAAVGLAAAALSWVAA